MKKKFFVFFFTQNDFFWWFNWETEFEECSEAFSGVSKAVPHHTALCESVHEDSQTVL